LGDGGDQVIAQFGIKARRSVAGTGSEDVLPQEAAAMSPPLLDHRHHSLVASLDILGEHLVVALAAPCGTATPFGDLSG
jgi:hypothetical protein